MAKRARKKTESELADSAFRERGASQSRVLKLAVAECEKLSKSRFQFILDVADYHWINRFQDLEDESAFEKESSRWDKLRRDFLRTVEKPLEIHCFTCNSNPSRGIKPLLGLIKHPSCNAGTALRLFWINDPAYYSRYRTRAECPYDEEREVMRLLWAIKRRFDKDDYRSRKICFDPAPWR
jgi:hypothetical protein